MHGWQLIVITMRQSKF